jgi:hypothetical protein
MDNSVNEKINIAGNKRIPKKIKPDHNFGQYKTVLLR